MTDPGYLPLPLLFSIIGVGCPGGFRVATHSKVLFREWFCFGPQFRLSCVRFPSRTVPDDRVTRRVLCVGSALLARRPESFECRVSVSGIFRVSWDDF